MTILVKPFSYTVLLDGKDATQDLREFGASITYIDNAESEADTIEIAMGDPDGRWRDEWYPDPGMTVEFSVKYDGEEGESGEIPPVQFEIDNPKFSSRAGGSGGKKVRLRGKTVPISLPLNTKGSEEFEEQTLSAIAAKIASDLGLELVGEFENDISLKRVTREDETPLEFLKRLSEKYGYWFKIESKTKLVFYSKKALDAQEPAFSQWRIGRHRSG